MKNKTLALFGIGTYILSVFSSASDVEGNSVAPIVLIAISGIAAAVFYIMAIVRLWKEAKGISITLISSAVALFILSVVQGFVPSLYGSLLVILLNLTKLINFGAFILAIIALYKSRVFNSHIITKTRDYYLNQPVNEASDLIEYTAEEYQTFEMAGWVKMLEDEKIYHGKEVDLNGSRWYADIGASKGAIYKISLQVIDKDINNIENIFKSTLNYLTKEMGKHSEHPFLSKRYIWDAPEGNLICNQLSKFGNHCINIIITSSSISEQMKNYVSKQQGEQKI